MSENRVKIWWKETWSFPSLITECKTKKAANKPVAPGSIFKDKGHYIYQSLLCNLLPEDFIYTHKILNCRHVNVEFYQIEFQILLPNLSALSSDEIWKTKQYIKIEWNQKGLRKHTEGRFLFLDGEFPTLQPIRTHDALEAAGYFILTLLRRQWDGGLLIETASSISL